jgi:predicted metal-binding membrane protein
VTEETTSLFEAVLRRDRAVVVAALVVVITLSWVWIVTGAGMGMNAIEMTRMPRDMVMTPAIWTPAYAALMFLMWWVMMLAMMLPSAAPVLLIFTRISRHRSDDKPAWTPTGCFSVGYLAVWGAFSAVATALQWMSEGVGLVSPMMATTAVWLGALILIGAGLWQFAPLKQACLRYCRSPIGFLTGRWRGGSLGAFRMGLEHGTHCLGCCWFLMALLFFGGVMNLWWIGGLAAYILIEKVFPISHWLSYAAGMGLIVCGAFLLISA